jgi:sigma-B regulation protein RsbU (phosphoserine phosphatase)
MEADMTAADREADRLRAVARYSILDTPPDGAFDRAAALAARWFGVPIATVTIVDSDRIWFKATDGLDGVVQLGRELGLCASAILQDEPYHVDDALTDPRVAGNSLVHGPMGIRFYAAAPLITPDGHRLGTVNVLDTVPREVSEDDLRVLADLAAIVMDELELRLSALTTLRHEREQHRQMEEFATALQRTLLPPTLPQVPGLQLDCHYHAASRVGGDFYDVFFVAPGRWAFFLGDVQGHGVEAAVVTSHVRYALRAAAMHHSDPADALAELNWSLLQEPSTDRFCTVVFGLLEPDPGGDGWRVTIATGGHLPALWIRPADGAVSAVLPSGGMLVGAVSDASFSQCGLHLRADETLMFHTDGLTENRSADGRLGEQGVVEHLERRLPVGARAAVEIVKGLIDGMSPTDDVAVLAFSPVVSAPLVAAPAQAAP